MEEGDAERERRGEGEQEEGHTQTRREVRSERRWATCMIVSEKWV